MTKATPTSPADSTRRRTTAILGLVAIVLLQVSIAAHQFKHSADHGFNVCHACTAYNQLEDVAHTHAAPADFGVAIQATPISSVRLAAPADDAAPYQPRAPPNT